MARRRSGRGGRIGREDSKGTFPKRVGVLLRLGVVAYLLLSFLELGFGCTGRGGERGELGY